MSLADVHRVLGGQSCGQYSNTPRSGVSMVLPRHEQDESRPLAPAAMRPPATRGMPHNLWLVPSPQAVQDDLQAALDL